MEGQLILAIELVPVFPLDYWLFALWGVPATLDRANADSGPIQARKPSAV